MVARHPAAVPRLTLSELRALVTLGEPAEHLSVAVGVPAAVVVPDGGTAAEAGVLGPALGSLPCVLLAEPGAPDWLAPVVDVCAPDAAALDAVLARVAANPLAATTLALLLRGAGARAVDQGLVAESATYSLLQAGPEFARWRAGRPARASAADREPVVAARHDDELHITLNRPTVHNALDRGLRDALAEALALAVADPSIDRILLRGAGRSFCSGGDLDEFGSFPDPASAHGLRLTRSPARLLARLAARTEVHVHGACVGSGIELAAFAAHVVAHPNTVIALPEVALGLVPGAGGTVSLPRRIGRHRTALLALSDMQLDAPTALAWGLVDAVAG